MPSTIPIPMKADLLLSIKQQISILTARRATLEVKISHAQNALEPITEELKELETRKAQLQDELEKQNNP